MPKRKALLIGASGLIGSHCLRYLLKDDHYSKVTCLVRHPIALDHPKLVQHTVDFDLPKSFASLAVGHDLFCCLGTTMQKAGSKEKFRKVDLDYPVTCAKLALKNGAKQFLLVSAAGSDPHSSVFYNRVKGEVEQATIDLGFETTHLFRPSILLGKREERRPAESLAQKLARPLSFAFRGPLKQYKPVEARTVAWVMVTAAKMDKKGLHTYTSHEIFGEFKTTAGV